MRQKKFLIGNRRNEIMNIRECFIEFIDYKQMYCENDTIIYYENCYNKFIDTMQICENEDIKTINKELYQAFIKKLRNEEIRNTSIRTYTRGFRVFIRYLYSEEYIEKDFTVNCKTPREENLLEMPLSVKEVKLIDEFCENKSILGLRNFIIIHLMLDVGLRLNEVVQLRIKDIELADNYIKLLDCKYNKNRIVPLPNLLKQAIKKYLNIRKGVKNEFLFLTHDYSKEISPITIKQMFTKLKKQTGIKRIHAHLLRHTFATSYLIESNNLEYLRVLLGHEDYNVTRNYIKLATQIKIVNYDIYRIDMSEYKKIGLIK